MLIDVGVFVARLIVGGVLLVAGLAKIRSGHNQLLNAIIGYDLLPKPMALVMANVLPWLEVLVGGLIIVGLWTHIATFVGAGLLMVFSSVVAVSLLRGKNQDCGCFQPLTPVQWRLVYRNLGLMSLLLPIYAFGGGAWVVESWGNAQAGIIPDFPIDLALLIGAWAVATSAALLLDFITRQRLVNQPTFNPSKHSKGELSDEKERYQSP
jgi:uncharacterized membrane protein YphA (DoxX/SURF4 family)